MRLNTSHSETSKLEDVKKYMYYFFMIKNAQFNWD